jgi:hypothetical protein
MDGLGVLRQQCHMDRDSDAAAEMRIRLLSAVPCLRMWRGRFDNTIVFNGTKVQPRPKL